MRILIFGVTGMLGSMVFKVLRNSTELDVYGTTRSTLLPAPKNESTARIIPCIDVENTDSLVSAFTQAKPDVVINCIGLVKQLACADDPLQAVPINSLLPHKLSSLCKLSGARLIHISTDCVFSGSKGNYLESDFADADDIYGRTKLLGELYYSHTITLRTSIIGHELNGNRSLINWFLSQNQAIKGFTKAFFSGVPTFELATIIRDFVLPRPDINGLYHVAAAAINKHDLLTLVSKTYNKKIQIIADENLIINRSLNADKFNLVTGYSAPSWPELIQKMHDFQ